MPAPSGFHAKLLGEEREHSPYSVQRATSGLPGHIRIADWTTGRAYVWSGHRDLLPRAYRFARDENGLLRRPDSDG